MEASGESLYLLGGQGEVTTDALLLLVTLALDLRGGVPSLLLEGCRVLCNLAPKLLAAMLEL